MAIELKLGTPTFTVAKGPPISGVGMSVTVTNGAEPVEADQAFLELLGTASGQTEVMADDKMPLHAFAAHEARECSSSVQLDPGEWGMFVYINDPQGNHLDMSGPHTVTIPGPVHHSEQFADSSKLQFTIEPTHVHKDASTLAKVEYKLSCTGSVDILPGFPIAIKLKDSDGNEGEQFYQLEHGVHRGASEPKFLHVTVGESKGGDTAKLTLTGDVGGAAAKEFHFTLTWKDDGTADVTPA